MISSTVRKLIHNRFVRFLFVGGLNTAFSYVLYALLLRLGLGFLWAATLSTIIGVLFNFQTTGRLVFKNNENRLLFRFIGVYLVTYSVNVTGLQLMDMAGVNSYLSGAVMVFPVAMLSFLLMRTFVFRGQS